jgi:hypothetical protein
MAINTYILPLLTSSNRLVDKTGVVSSNQNTEKLRKKSMDSRLIEFIWQAQMQRSLGAA